MSCTAFEDFDILLLKLVLEDLVPGKFDKVELSGRTGVFIFLHAELAGDKEK
jgi:hypothetical protein